MWQPGVTLPSERELLRGLLDARGIIHAHSVYSQDACDDEPVVDGVRDPVCFDDFRTGMCLTQHDFVMLTDHAHDAADYEFPDLLLYDEARGDELVERDAAPVASWSACGEGARFLTLAGLEEGVMPVGLEHHAAEDRNERFAVYYEVSPEAIESLRAAGAVVLVQHTEDWSVEDLVDLPLDGFEMFNLHASMMQHLAEFGEVYVAVTEGDTEGFEHPDLMMLRFIGEDDRYLERWAAVLSAGVRRVTTMATDCHRNSFRQELPDGERGDSYRRMMAGLSNHLLLEPEADGTWDDRHLKEALAAGRLYGTFDILGYPGGFDFHALVGDAVEEMGAEIELTDAPTLVVTLPTVRQLDGTATPPEITLRLLRAEGDSWQEVATSDTDIEHVPTQAGAYRAEVRMVPHHLEAYLGDRAQTVLSHDWVWVYSNAIYLR